MKINKELMRKQMEFQKALFEKFEIEKEFAIKTGWIPIPKTEKQK